ncbi:MAG: peptide ABC transporter substrate-binding protein, partial [Polyangiaceae bacterium]|nr:peptide ABC transporter substrate-binding protein [Polyangiaceae bacterium]
MSSRYHRRAAPRGQERKRRVRPVHVAPGPAPARRRAGTDLLAGARGADDSGCRSMTRHTTARRARHGWAAICAVGVLGALGGLTACGRDEPGYFGTVGRGGKDAATFYLNNGDEPEYLDPGLVSDTASSALVRELFDGLVLAHPDDQHPVQGVAERYDTSDDNLLYRFHLRADARWTDGTPVTAHDFVYAWQRVLTPATGARNATLLYALTNGKLFHQGKILRLGTAVRPRDGHGTAQAELAAGTFVRVYATSPARLKASRALAAAPEPGASESVGDDKDGAPVRVLGLGPPLRCNGEGDHWFRLEAGGREGWAPGCALLEDAAHAEEALVSVAVVPTYAPRRPVPAEAAPVAGLVPRALLVADASAVGVRAVDDRTLEVELERPTPHFLELCTLPTLSPVPRAVVERFTARGESDRWFRPESIVSNGPYALENWKFRYEISMVRNPHHPDFERLRMHRLVFLQVNDVQACLNLYRTGEIDYIGSNVSLPSAYMDSLAKQGDFSRFVWLGTYWYELNVKAPP